MKITIFAGTTRVSPFNDAGERIASHARLAVQLGHQVVIVAPEVSPGLPAAIAIPGVSVVPFRRESPFRNPIRCFATANPRLALQAILASSPDLVLLQGTRATPAMLLLGALGQRVVLDLPVLEEDLIREVLDGRGDFNEIKTAERLACREAEGILAATPADCAVLVKRHAAHLERVHSIPALCPRRGTSVDSGVGDELAWSGDATSPQGAKSFGRFLTRILPLLRVLRPGTRSVVAGPGTESARGTIGVDVLGAVADLEPVYRRARCVVLPLEKGIGCPAKLRAALTRGVPVVATSAALRRSAGFDDAGIVKAETDDQIVKELIRLLDDRAFAATLGQAGRSHAATLEGEPSVRDALAAALDRARRAFVDPAQKLEQLRLLSGRWPRVPEKVLPFLAKRRFVF